MHEAIRRLRDVAPLPEHAAVGPGLSPVSNAHIHLPPNFSAFDSFAHAVALAAAQGVRILGASNYYDYSLYPQFAATSLAAGCYPFFGLAVIALIRELR